MSEDRTAQIRKGRYVETASLIEIGVSLTTGFLTGSSALISWGADSIVESNSAAFMVWHLHGEEQASASERCSDGRRLPLAYCRVLSPLRGIRNDDEVIATKQHQPIITCKLVDLLRIEHEQTACRNKFR